ncbi:hypothetical protein J4N45_10015 [Vibrio sp. SCSIO 43140]|uniref:hypothetical protein n=1 Tax=Vibrio sp. SCSIO 43140 TaxID=2819100 RepID=UPI002076679C|nr:hypothetical protein [Vibrio sp. SCSIO 43140]USD58864.1 hypothetical protein J4N45_10015 [Vibrio sp. SCSIO 43140]
MAKKIEEYMFGRSTQMLMLVVVVYVGAYVLSLSPRTMNHYKSVERMQIDPIKRKSTTHREFAEVYLACNGYFLPKVNKNCFNAASIAIQHYPNAKEVMLEYLGVKVTSFDKAYSVWELMNPIEVYDALKERARR